MRTDGGAAIEFVARQVKLEAGEIDLLFVDGNGLPIVVEVKLARNSEARREVVAQAIDYISSLTELTVDELDEKVGGKLEDAIQDLSEGDDSKFDLIWKSVGTDLRGGQARLIVAMDSATAGLQRIFGFLARALDVQLISIARYSSSGSGEIFVPSVPQILVSRESAEQQPRTERSREPYKELVDVFDVYNASAPPDLRAVGAAANYRIIRPADWPVRGDLHYSFAINRRNFIDVQLQIHPGAARLFTTILASFDGTPVAGGTLRWDGGYDAGRGRLFVGFPLTIPPETVAQAMRALVEATRTTVSAKLKELNG